MNEIEQRIGALGLVLPPPPAPAGNYLPYRRSGNTLYLAGAICTEGGRMTHTGKVGAEHTVESAQAAARVCVLNALAAAKAAVGDLGKVTQVLFVNGYVNAVEGFADSPAVLNGASDLLVKIFGDRGRHARAAVAVAGLPKDSTVEIQMILEVAD